jgi:predicted dehydrogenase
MNTSLLNAAPLRVGLIGWGYASQVFHGPLISTTPGLQWVAVSSRQPERVRADLGETVAVHADPVSLIARTDLDVVVIPTPNDTHYPLALAALQAGHAVVVDKPFTLETEEARHLVAVARERGQFLSVFHNRRWDGDFLTARALLASGRLGRITHAQLHFDRFRPTVRERWREGNGPGAGIWYDLGPHLLDQAVQLFGRPVALQADLLTQRTGGQSPDGFHARLRWADGLRADLHASMLAAQPGPRFALHGTLGSWVKHGLDAQEDALKAGQRPDPTQPAAWGADAQAGTLTTVPANAPDATPLVQAWPTLPGAYPAYYAGVRDALRGLAPNPVPADEALCVQELLNLGVQSALERQELALPPA